MEWLFSNSLANTGRTVDQLKHDYQLLGGIPRLVLQGDAEKQLRKAIVSTSLSSVRAYNTFCCC